MFSALDIDFIIKFLAPLLRRSHRFLKFIKEYHINCWSKRFHWQSSICTCFKWLTNNNITIDLDLFISKVFFEVCVKHLDKHFVLIEDLYGKFKLTTSFLIYALCFLTLSVDQIWCWCWRFISFFRFNQYFCILLSNR